MQFLSKARTLEALQPVLCGAKVLPQCRFTVAEWRAGTSAQLARVVSRGWAEMVVRSSAVAEDSLNASLAGRFESVLRVEPHQLEEAIASVIESMTNDDGHIDEDNEVFVQPMLRDVAFAGVAFSCDPSTGAPYYVVNYDDVNGHTDSVTSGRSNELKTCYIQHLAPTVPSKMAGLVALLQELGTLFGGHALDVEFAYTSQGAWVLLQVRALIPAAAPSDAHAHLRILKRIAAKVEQGQRPQPFLHGRRTIYGVMPDWNPAEIIGVRPKPLALSLYRELVTDSIWAYQRHNYGYRNLRSFPLMLHFHGLPYIDVRVSFNSFIPRDIEGSLADKLVNHYVDRLLAAPNLHDKVEFEIVFSCYTLDLPQRLARLESHGFSKQECAQLADSLRGLTNRIIDNNTGLWRSDRDKLDVLAARREQILAAGSDKVSCIYWLLEDCKRYGTLPFAGLARAGFIAVQMLSSLVSVGVLDKRDYDAFMNGLNTVSGQMTRDLARLDRTTFLARYGHLRPGTYDLLSPRYDEAPDLYFDWHAQAPEPASHEPFALSLQQMRAISSLLEEHGLTHDVVGLFDFLQAGIELREYAKFVFCRSLSDAMSLFRELGREHGFSVEDMAYADVRTVYELYAGSAEPAQAIAESIEQGRRRFQESCQITLPPLLADPADVFMFEMPGSEPNFITQRQVTASVVSHHDRHKLAGAIVAIPSADPGFDWLFSHNIAGFITAYGGANSHMAIRANELGLPAIIGAGETLYGKWSTARLLNIDCANRRVEVLQ
jgi:glutamine kinase